MVASRQSMHLDCLQLFLPARALHFDEVEQMLLASGVANRLVVAAVLGSAIGLEREFNKKPLGWRTNLLVCCGCAMFTFLSAVLAGDGNPDKGRVASNIVQGIGFLGAGLILHNRNRVTGMTSAATVFVVASIGMACGAGLFVPAEFATIIVLIATILIGLVEVRFNIKTISKLYEVRGRDQQALELAVLNALDKQGKRLVDPQRDSFAGIQRVTFPVLGTLRQHRELQTNLRSTPAIDVLLTHGDAEDE
ncbi:MAG TPA: MgtC/SapB family protein [Acidobacteriaceae bacterium]